MPAPFGSGLNAPALKAALAAVAEAAAQPAPAEPGQPQGFGSPGLFGSGLNTPAMQNAMAAVAEAAAQATAQTTAQETQASQAGGGSASLFGSGLNAPAVQAALASVAEAARQPAQESQGASTNPALFGSGLNAPAVQAALQSQGQARADEGVALAQTIKNALNGGELSPDLAARHDLPRTQNGCHTLLNMVPLPAGGVTKRPGFAYVNYASPGSRLIPFNYSSSLKLMLQLMPIGSGCRLFSMGRDAAPNISQTHCSLPYRHEELASLSWCQSGKIIYLAHPNHPPAKLVYDGASFSYHALNFSNHTPIPDIAGMSYEGLAELNTFRNVFYKVTAVNDETGEESLPSPEHCWFTCTLTTSFSALIKIRTVPGCSEYRVYKKRGGLYGYIGRLVLPPDYTPPPGQGAAAADPATGSDPVDASVLGTDPDVFHDTGYEPDTSDTPPRAQAFFQGPGDYPSLVFIHQQRLGWAATDNEPLTLWFSQTSNYECLASKQPPQDDDGIEATLAASQANRILWAQSDRAGLALGTEGEEWYLTGASGEGAVISPNSLAFQPQTHYGSKPGTPALRADSSLLFIQRGGRIIRDLGYSFQTDRYEARDLTLLARHLFHYNTITGWCWQGSPHYILWLVTNTGRLVGLTYMPDNEVIAWHRHETAGRIESCATLDDSDGVSRLWLIVDRGEEGAFVERMDAFLDPAAIDWDLPWQDAGAYRHRDGRAGHEFRARVVPCLPESQAANGVTAMRVNKINAVSCRIMQSFPFQAQVHDENGIASRILPVPVRAPSSNHQYSVRDDWMCPIGAGFLQNSRLELILDGPLPATILAVNFTVETAAQAGSQDGKT